MLIIIIMFIFDGKIEDDDHGGLIGICGTFACRQTPYMCSGMYLYLDSPSMDLVAEAES